MNRLAPVSIFVFSALLLSLSGCAAPKYSSEAPPLSADQTLSEGYALLHTLLASNQRVGGIFLIKSASEDFKSLIQEITRESANARQQLEDFAAADASISLKGANLPEVEVETRSAIEETVSAELLGSSGPDFQKRLAIEQIKATRYASHLAKSLAAIDPNPDRAAYLNDLAAGFENLHDRLQNVVSVSGGETASE